MDKPPLPKPSDNPPWPIEAVEWVDGFIPDAYEEGEKMRGAEVKVDRLPRCDICVHEGRSVVETALYDGKTCFGPWANMCQAHFETYGVGLGMGRGQKLVLRDDDEPDS